MRLGFAGTPEFAAIILRELINTPHEVVRILTQPGRVNSYPTWPGELLYDYGFYECVMTAKF